MNRIGTYEINLLPFHRMGDSKWNQLGKNYAYSKEEATDEKIMNKLQELYLDRKIAYYIGSDTTF